MLSVGAASGSRRARPPASVTAEGLEALLHPVEELLVPAQGGLHRRLDDRRVPDDRAQVDQGPHQAGHPQGTEPAGVRRGEQLGPVQGQARGDIVAGAGGRELHDVARLDAVQLPQRRRRPVGDGRLGPGPQPARHELLLPGPRCPGNPVDTLMNPLPLAGVEAMLDSPDPEAGIQGLLTGEDTELPGRQMPKPSFFVR